METFTIGQVAQRAGVSVETIRFYEREKLIARPLKPRSGYRQYPVEVVARIRFIQRTKALGFSLKESAELLALRLSERGTCEPVKRRTLAKIADIDDKMRALRRMKKVLSELADACDGGSRPTAECPILGALYPED